MAAPCEAAVLWKTRNRPVALRGTQPADQKMVGQQSTRARFLRAKRRRVPSRLELARIRRSGRVREARSSLGEDNPRVSTYNARKMALLDQLRTSEACKIAAALRPLQSHAAVLKHVADAASPARLTAALQSPAAVPIRSVYRNVAQVER